MYSEEQGWKAICAACLLLYLLNSGEVLSLTGRISSSASCPGACASLIKHWHGNSDLSTLAASMCKHTGQDPIWYRHLVSFLQVFSCLQQCLCRFETHTSCQSNHGRRSVRSTERLDAHLLLQEAWQQVFVARLYFLNSLLIQLRAFLQLRSGGTTGTASRRHIAQSRREAAHIVAPVAAITQLHSRRRSRRPLPSLSQRSSREAPAGPPPGPPPRSPRHLDLAITP
jgi:hypothetical protein